MENSEIARALLDVADLLEIQEANPFRVRAYRNAARTVEAETTPLRQQVERGATLTALPGIGKEMAAHIRELVGTGQLTFLAELAAEFPRGLLELIRLPGVGPKRARLLWRELGVDSAEALAEAAKAGRIAALRGFGEKTQTKILSTLEVRHGRERRISLAEADRVVEPLLAHLRGAPGLTRLEAAGSFRRRRETVADIDLLAIARDPRPVVARFTGYSGVERVESAGETKVTVRLRSGLQVDLRILPRKSFGAAWVYFTGSKEHNIHLRRLGVERGLRISEYGVFRDPRPPAAAAAEDAAPRAAKDPWAGELIAGREEKDVYGAVDLPWIPPELREDRGEFGAARAGELPRLLEPPDLRGDLQMHSTWSDGRNTIEEMLAACAARGYEYFALTDHSKALPMVRGLDRDRLRQQWKEIDAVQRRHPEIRLLRGMEVDILGDGTLDLEDDLLARLDIVLASIHSGFALPPAEQTRRILAAVRHPAVQILAHPTGRRIGRREAAAFDVEAVLQACKEEGVAVEHNAHPERLDLKDTHLIRARELGCKIVISTDAHRIRELDNIRYGVEQARRAWLTKQHVLNTLPLPKLLATLRPRPK
jgi:DNA polymerase (family 10)